MTVPGGTRFGPYEIVGLIGAGGMGEVHRARDTRLGREVALKTLPAGLAVDSERLRRFEIEAKAASLLSHPNILTIYDIGTADGRPYIVSELLEGENLRERLNRGPLPSRKVVEIGAAVADALAAAHGRGIVHRDLKPENLFLQRDGRPKVLDFGIAKLTTPEAEKPGAAPTITILTDIGVAVGTLGYMAPEQVRGEPVDHRSDIFALGAILHEMLAGQAAFRRDSRIATVNAVLESDPPELPDELAPAIRRIIRRCLEKNPDERFQSARDLGFALNALSDAVPTATGTIARASKRTTIDWRIAVATLLAAGLGAAAAWTWREAPPSVPRSVKRFVFHPPVPMLERGLAISKDGTRIAYAVSGAVRPQLQIQPFDQLDSKPLAGTEGAYVPFFSPDGQWVAFAADGKLRKVPVAGGTPITICDASDMLEGDWGSNGQIVIATRQHGLRTVSAEGGAPQPLTTPDPAGEIDHHAPHVLPGSRALLFTIHAGPEVFRIAVRSLETNEQRTIVDDGFFARYLPSGHIVYGRGDTLVAAPFDLDRLEITGPAVPVVERVATDLVSGIATFSPAADGTLAYRPAVSLGGRSLTWVDRTGRAEPLRTPPGAYDYPKISPDGKKLAVEIADGLRHNIFVYDFGADLLSRVTLDGAESRPVWSPDGRRLTYSARRKEERHIMWQSPDGSTPPQSLVSSTTSDLWAGGWTPDNENFVFVDAPPTSLYDIKVVRTQSGARPEPLIANPPPELGPVLSPDGAWIAYASYDNGAYQIYIRRRAGGEPRQVSTDGGTQARWAGNGRELFYRRRLSTSPRLLVSQGQVMAVPVQTEPTLVIGKPAVLFEDVYHATMEGPSNYDVSADGQRFVFVKSAADERAPRPVYIVQDWSEELKRRVPVQR